MSLPDRIRLLRSYVSGLSQRELSRLAGLNPVHVQAIESGHIANVKIVTICALAEVLGTSVDWLASGSGVVPSARRVRAAVDARRRAQHSSEHAPTGRDHREQVP